MPYKQEIELFWGFISRSIERIMACLDGLPEDDLNWRPLTNANSLYVLANHILGTTEENILGVLCGQSIQRQREAELTAEGNSVDPLLLKWLDLQKRIHQSLEQLPAEELEREREHPRRGSLTGRAVLIVVARHAAEHMGQAELTRDLLFVKRGRILPPRAY